MSKRAKSRGKDKGKKLEDEADEKEESLAFKILSADQCNELLAQDVEQMQKTLCEIFKLSNYSTDLKDAATLDYYTGATWWAKEQGFDAQQMSGFFTVTHTLYNNVKDIHMARVDNLKEFKKMLIGIDPDHADVRSSGLDFFNTTQAKAIIGYVHSCLFQHYKLYELMFTQTQAEEIIGTDLEIEVAKPANMPFPPPLDEGVSQEMFASYIATPPPTPPPEVSGDQHSQGEITEEAAEEKDELKELETKLEGDIFSQLTPDDIREVIESVTKEMLGSLQTDLAAKLREKENNLLSRINKVHKVAEDAS